MESVAPILASTYLGDAELFALFCASPATAQAVLAHAPRTTLTLGGSGVPPADIASSKQLAVVMQLAVDALPGSTHAACMVLAMHGRMVVPTASLWQRITELSLTDMQLSPDQVISLGQLSRPQPLKKLRLQRCYLQAPTHGQAAASTTMTGAPTNGQATAVSSSSKTGAPTNGQAAGSTTMTSAPTHGQAAAVSSSNSSTTGAPTNGQAAAASSGTSGIAVLSLECLGQGMPLTSALQLINKDVLQHLTSDIVIDGDTDSQLLGQLPALQQLHLNNASMTDSGFQCILAHPSITHVTLRHLVLTLDYSSVQPASLREITMTSQEPHPAFHSSTLAALPLASIHRITIHHDLVSDNHPGHMSKVEPYLDKVVCLGSRHVNTWDPTVPAFWLVFDADDGDSCDDVRVAVAVCSRNLQGTLTICDLPGPAEQALAALKAGLSPTVTSLCFVSSKCEYLFDGWEGPDSHINLMPGHVTHVVLSSLHMTMGEVRRLVTGVTRNVKITLYDCAVERDGEEEEEEGWDQDLPEDEDEFQELVRAWVGADHPYTVEVEVVGGLAFLPGLIQF